jgi:RNA polymerase sigma-70 factor (ECF subfamily)
MRRATPPPSSSCTGATRPRSTGSFAACSAQPLAAQTDEVFQDTWLRVVNARERWEPQGATFRTWLFTLAHHRVIDLLRRSGREISVDAFEGDGDEPWQPDAAAWQHWPAPAGAAPQGDELAFWRRAGEKLLDCLEQLPLPQRSAFLLHHDDGLTLDEVAHALEVGFETAKTRLRYAMSKLRTCMGAYLEPVAAEDCDERRRARRLAARSAAPRARFRRAAAERRQRGDPAEGAGRRARRGAAADGTFTRRAANPLTRLWDWLARPPVAAGFASVMAATLVGLMWWDRPMDEAMPRSPARVSDRAPAAPSPAPTPSAAADTSPLASTAPTLAATPPASRQEAIVVAPSVPDPRPMNATENKAAVDDGTVRRRQRSAPEQVGAAEAARAEPAATPAPRSVDSLAKERAPTAEKKNEAPAPFPSAEMQRERPTPRPSLDTAAPSEASKKDAEASRSRAADEVERAAVSPTARPVAPPAAMRPPPVGAAEPAPQAPLASGQLAGDERTPAAPAEGAVAARAKSAAATPPVSTTPTDATRLQQRQSAFGGMREQDAMGRASSAPVPSATPAPFRGESQRSGSETLSRADAGVGAVAPARVLAAIAAEPGRWTRQTAGGDTVALDPAGAPGSPSSTPPRPVAGSRSAAPPRSPMARLRRDGSTTVRLVNAGRVAAIVRLDGTRVQVDAAPGTDADRWQATLVPASAEHLRSTARRLSP